MGDDLHRDKLPRLTEEQVDDLLFDLEIQRAGMVLCYAADPHEMFDFCFPTLQGSPTAQSIRKQADDQIALYEVFFKSDPPPLLLSEYTGELERVLAYVRTIGARGYARLDTVDRMISRSRAHGSKDMDDAQLDRYVGENFMLLLSALMGVFSLGGDRLEKVAVQLGRSAGRIAALLPKGILDQYSETEIVDEAFSAALRFVKFKDEHEEQRVRRSALLDSRAVDLLLYLNREVGHRSEFSSSPRVVFAYLSSAPKSERIFHLDCVKRAFPIILGHPYRIWRTRLQVFTYAAYRVTDGQGGIDYDATEQNLVELKSALASLRESSRVWPGPTIAAEDTRRSAANLISTLEQRAERSKMEIANWGLLANIAEYKQLADGAATNYREVRELFLRIYERNVGTRRAFESMKFQLQTMAAQTVMGLGVAASVTRDLISWLKDGRDSITSNLQYLPVRPAIPDGEYGPPLKNILQFFTAPPLRMPLCVPLLLKAYDAFLNRPEPDTKDPGREMVRCYLYFSFFGQDGDARAFRHALAMAREFPKRSIEFDYIACWAARRARLFRDSFEIASGVIGRQPDDPRFFHGRALTIYAWLSDEKERRECPLTIRNAVEDMQAAVSRYKHSPADLREMIGISLNNLVFMHCKSVRGEPIQLAVARGYFDEMQLYLPKATWGEAHPELYHTSALLKYQESLTVIDSAPREEVRAKLQSALEEAELAVRYLSKVTYRELRDSIQLALQHL